MSTREVIHGPCRRCEGTCAVTCDTFFVKKVLKEEVREEVSYRDASQPKKFAHTQKKHVDHLKISRGIFQHKNFGGGDDSG